MAKKILSDGQYETFSSSFTVTAVPNKQYFYRNISDGALTITYGEESSVVATGALLVLVYDGTYWTVLNEAGNSITWLGELAVVPTDPDLMDAYYNTVDGQSYIYNGTTWDTLAPSGQSITWSGELATAPTAPITLEAYYNTTDGQSYIYSGSAWEQMAQKGDQGYSITWSGNLASAPTSPEYLEAYYNTTDLTAYIYDGSSWSTIAEQGQSITWSGELATAPTSPSSLEAYYNTTEQQAYIYNGTDWDQLSQKGDQGDSITWSGELTTAPSSPSYLEAYYNSTDYTSYIYNGSSWDTLSEQGYSIVWLGELAVVPTTPSYLEAYYNTVDGQSYIYNGTDWDQLSQKGDQGIQGETGPVWVETNAISELTITDVGTFNTTTGVTLTQDVDIVGIATLDDLSVGADALINGLTVGRGGGAATSNTANGVQALYSNTSGQHNTGIGYQALHCNTIAFYNTGIGYKVLYSNTTGYKNTANGAQALYSNTSGQHNTALGHEAGGNLTTGSNNILLGYNTQTSAVDADNETVIGNGDTESCVLRGETSIVDSLDATIASFESDAITIHQPLNTEMDDFDQIALYRPVTTVAAGVNISFELDNSANVKTQYAQLFGSIVDSTPGSEDGSIVLRCMLDGVTDTVSAVFTGSTCSNTTGVWATISDEAVKENIKEVSSPIDKVLKIADCVKQYNYRIETGIEQNQRTQFIAQELIEAGFKGHVNESDPMNEAVGGLLGWEYGDKEIDATYDEDGKILTEATTERIVTTEGRQQYSVEQNLTPYLFPAFKELHEMVEAQAKVITTLTSNLETQATLITTLTTRLEALETEE